MTPLADGADLAAPPAATAADAYLQGGEEIILVLRPSGWFVVLASWPVLVAAALIAAGAVVADPLVPAHVPKRLITLGCSLVVVVRLMAACFQWGVRLYVLTNRRALRIQGFFRRQAQEFLLHRVSATRLTAMRVERVLGVASLVFDLSPGPQGASEAHWDHLAGAAAVQEVVDQAVRRAKNTS